MALRKRLTSGDLTGDDRALILRVSKLRALREQGNDYPACAAEMGCSANALRKFVGGSLYQVVVDALDAAIDAVDERAMQRAIQRGRISMAGLVPEAMKFLRECFARHPAGTIRNRGTPRERDVSGQLVDLGLAQWATAQITKGTGLMEPVSVTPPQHVNATFINQIIYMSRGDDAEAAKAAAVETIDITPGTNP